MAKVASVPEEITDTWQQLGNEADHLIRLLNVCQYEGVINEDLSLIFKLLTRVDQRAGNIANYCHEILEFDNRTTGRRPNWVVVADDGCQLTLDIERIADLVAYEGRQQNLGTVKHLINKALAQVCRLRQDMKPIPVEADNLSIYREAFVGAEMQRA
jgi:hypothetical protein